MARAFATSLVFVAGALADKLGDMDQGAEFTKCIALEDFHSKTLDDDITLHDRDAEGCCGQGHVPGATLHTYYRGSQVVCGVMDDGTVVSSYSMTTKYYKICDYGKCYVFKQGLECSDGTKQLLNGCCGATKGNRTFEDACKGYDYTHSSDTAGESATVDYCVTEQENYGTKGFAGTAEADDDIADGSFQVDKFYSYAPCDGGLSMANAAGMSWALPALAVAGLSFLKV